MSGEQRHRHTWLTLHAALTETKTRKERKEKRVCFYARAVSEVSVAHDTERWTPLCSLSPVCAHRGAQEEERKGEILPNTPILLPHGITLQCWQPCPTMSLRLLLLLLLSHCTQPPLPSLSLFV